MHTPMHTYMHTHLHTHLPFSRNYLRAGQDQVGSLCPRCAFLTNKDRLSQGNSAVAMIRDSSFQGHAVLMLAPAACLGASRPVPGGRAWSSGPHLQRQTPSARETKRKHLSRLLPKKRPPGVRFFTRHVSSAFLEVQGMAPLNLCLLLHTHFLGLLSLGGALGSAVPLSRAVWPR